MNCKFCNAELEEGNSVCPVCGKNNAAEDTAPERETCTEPEPEIPAEETGLTAGEDTVEGIQTEGEDAAVDSAAGAPEKPMKHRGLKIGLAIAGGVVLLAVLVAVILYGINGGFKPRPNDVLYKDTYTVSDEKAAAAAGKVVATVGDKKLTNGELQVFYWTQVIDFLNSYGYYYVDYTQPLDEQVFSEEDGMTWQQYFLDVALETWQRYQVLEIRAEETGFEMDGDFKASLEALPADMEATAAAAGYESVDAMIQAELGAGCTFADYRQFLTLYYTAYAYFSQEYDKLNPTMEEIEAYFDENAAELATYGVTKDSGNLVDVRHILIEPQGGTEDEDGNVTYSDEEWETCRAEAQALLDEWLEGEATEDSFAELANEHSADPGSNTAGGLYSGVYQGYMTEAFDAWIFDESRQYGDYGLVQTEFGYHIMFFAGSEPEWVAYARDYLLSDLSNDLINNAVEAYPMEVNYKNIVLGDVNLAG